MRSERRGAKWTMMRVVGSVLLPWERSLELWEGAFVRGYRQAPGVPAFVKRVEGNGLYSIKMVGSNRGKFRVGEWKNLFKEGSFTKIVSGTDSVRIRVESRPKEKAQAARRPVEKKRRGKYRAR